MPVLERGMTGGGGMAGEGEKERRAREATSSRERGGGHMRL